MTTTPNMDLVLPVEGGSNDVWAVLLDAIFALIDAHDHTTGKGVKVPSNALNIIGDVAMGTHAFTGLSAVSFTEIAAASAAAYVGLFINSSDHNLYFRNGAGTNVQLTSGNTINISIVGGIGGDYSSVNALLSYVDADLDYLLQQEGSPRPWAGLRTGDIKLYQKAVGIANFIALVSPAALAASYTYTFPAALPASTALLLVSAAGVMTTPINPTLSGAISATDFKITGSKTIQMPASSADLNSNTRISGAQGMKGVQLNGGNAMTFPVPLHFFDQIIGYSVAVTKTTSAGTTIHAQLFTTDASGAETAQGVGSSNSANNPGTISLTEFGLTIGLATPWQAYLAVWATGGGTADVVNAAQVSYNRP